ncbi:(2Fe-2S) ferredoxin domain-containing protein [Alkalihalobacterium bogoriense]|uniref:(2Fe-2S) ferredoxin domain-containing protein n=1 Tax=Alkalihalobacterium bogoriense TaxID=246272 RepID=UPI00047C6A67|nr:(2Fe-2S) ferredoxin domain-containing protein [Alkalihalobacterium bogoriense]
MATWDLEETKHHIFICNGSSCMKKGGEEVTQAIRDTIAEHKLDRVIHTTRTRCNGRCENACVTILYPEGTWFKDVTPEIGKKIITEYIIKENKNINEVLYTYEDHFKLQPGNSEGKKK